MSASLGRQPSLGAWWGVGHGITLVVFGIPILLAERYLPERMQQGAETAVAVLIVFLALRLLVRWRHGYFDLHAHPHSERDHRHAVRTPAGALGVGLVHGMGGSAGVGILLLAAIPSETVAVVSLAAPRALHGRLDDGRDRRLRPHAHRAPVAAASNTVIPALGALSLAFGSGMRGAWSLAPYPF